MSRKHLLPVTLFAISIGFGAAFVPAQQDAAADTDTVISLGGKQIMNLRTGVGGHTAPQRADAVRERLVPILSIKNLTSEDAVVRQIRHGQDASIYVRGHLLVTVDRTLARADGAGRTCWQPAGRPRLPPCCRRSTPSPTATGSKENA